MTKSIRSRLRHVQPGDAALLTSLAGSLSLEPALADAPAWVVLRADAGWEAWLAPLYGPSGPVRVTGENGEPDALQAALALEAVEPLTAELERAWRTALDPVRLDQAAPDLRLAAEHLGCRALVAVRNEGGFHQSGNPPAPERVAAVPVPIEWRLAGPFLATERLTRLRSGDMILLPAEPRITVASAQASWTGRADLKMRTAVLDETGGGTMTTTDQGWAQARTPVELVIEGGAVPVGQLAALAPGAVLPLDLAGDIVPVTVRAGGVRIGSGELVAVGDAFGVVLTRVDLPASAVQAAAEPDEA